jgi:hypothetical protein
VMSKIEREEAERLRTRQNLDWIQSPEFTEAYLRWRQDDEGVAFEQSHVYRAYRIIYKTRINGVDNRI